MFYLNFIKRTMDVARSSSIYVPMTGQVYGQYRWPFSLLVEHTAHFDTHFENAIQSVSKTFSP